MKIPARALQCLLLAVCLSAAPLRAELPHEIMDGFSELPYVEVSDLQRDLTVRSHLVALGAMQKERGVWQPRSSERADGVLSRYTWRVLDAYPSVQLMQDLIDELSAAMALEELFSCDARACGSSAQWANRIFNQRVLYGRESEQRYRVYALKELSSEYRIMLYATARTADRQYLHAEVLQLNAGQ